MKSSYDDFRLTLTHEKQDAVRVAKGKGAVASVSKQATELGIKVLKDGGNAFDAAFTVAFALAIYHPQAGNIGGGGYVIFKEQKTKIPGCINYREMSPSGAMKESYLTEKGLVNPDATAFGPKSVCIPGTVKSFFTLQKSYGVLKAKDLLVYLSKLANEGCRITNYQAQCLNRLKQKLSFSQESKKIYGMKDRLFQNGDNLPNPDLAKTFLILAREGEKSFYEGKIAEQIEQDLTENGGYVTVYDLKKYTIKEVKPIFTEFKGKVIWSVPPEGGGAILIEILNILNRDVFFRIKPFTPDFFHYLSQSFKMASIDRFLYLGDTALKNNAAYKNIFKKKYTYRLFSYIDKEKDVKTEVLESLMHPEEKNINVYDAKLSGNETTHFSIIDNEGNAVSNSYTLNLRYGSKWSVNGAGFLLNGSIDAFSFFPGKPNYFGVIGNKPNLFAQNKRPASNMSPVLITDGSNVDLVIGTPGGPSIQSSLAMILLLIIGNNTDPPDAVQNGRIHHQAWPDILYKEIDGLPDDIIKALSHKGYTIQDKNEPIGDINGIFRSGDEYTAVSDYRREGYALSCL